MEKRDRKKSETETFIHSTEILINKWVYGMVFMVSIHYKSTHSEPKECALQMRKNEYSI